MENEFSLAENEETPGVEDAKPLVAIMVPAQGVMLPSRACKLASSLGRKALEFMKITLSGIIRYNTYVVVKTLSLAIHRLHHFKGFSICFQ